MEMDINGYIQKKLTDEITELKLANAKLEFQVIMLSQKLEATSNKEVESEETHED